ncbi:MAG: peptidylprolyl isomerase [Micrococcales bacterium]|nr:MAG: peptidylprolyl isomerase [Micrococcales bacterium]PIE27839.1 MAG: peptidylprolyl isomerase [Micrococcales bacterium]
MTGAGEPQQGGSGEQSDSPTVVVVGDDAMGVADGQRSSPADIVEEPGKIMRIGGMIKQLLEEVRSAPLDEAGRARLAQVHQRSIAELEKGLSADLVDELRSITLPFDAAQTPGEAELRIAQAQLVGWLEGLFHGIQTALMAQQMAAQTQISQMRKALPATGGQSGQLPPDGGDQRTGHYL